MQKSQIEWVEIYHIFEATTTTSFTGEYPNKVYLTDSAKDELSYAIHKMKNDTSKVVLFRSNLKKWFLYTQSEKTEKHNSFLFHLNRCNSSAWEGSYSTDVDATCNCARYVAEM